MLKLCCNIELCKLPMIWLSIVGYTRPTQDTFAACAAPERGLPITCSSPERKAYQISEIRRRRERVARLTCSACNLRIPTEEPDHCVPRPDLERRPPPRPRGLRPMITCCLTGSNTSPRMRSTELADATTNPACISILDGMRPRDPVNYMGMTAMMYVLGCHGGKKY